MVKAVQNYSQAQIFSFNRLCSWKLFCPVDDDFCNSKIYSWSKFKSPKMWQKFFFLQFLHYLIYGISNRFMMFMGLDICAFSFNYFLIVLYFSVSLLEATAEIMYWIKFTRCSIKQQIILNNAPHIVLNKFRFKVN